MPRPAWLAIGAAAGALALGTLPALAVVLLGVAGVCIAVAGRAGGVARGRHALVPGLGPVAVGMLAVALRALAAGDAVGMPGPIPSGDGPWVGVVETVGA